MTVPSWLPQMTWLPSGLNLSAFCSRSPDVPDDLEQRCGESVFVQDEQFRHIVRVAAAPTSSAIRRH